MTTAMSKSHTDDSVLRLPQVLSRFPVSRATWLAGVRDGRYPPSVKLGPRTTGWKKSDIDRLIATL